jgi:hypothetical protein
MTRRKKIKNGTSFWREVHASKAKAKTNITLSD